MTAQAQQLVEQALTFPPEERQQIAGALLQSMSAGEAAMFSPETIAKIGEVRRRFHAGEEKTISGEEFASHLKQKAEDLRAQNQGSRVF